MPETRVKYWILSALSGVAWGGLVALIAADAFPGILGGGLLASPAIGVAVGAATTQWCRLPAALRVVAALVSLYAAGAMFGLAVGLYDWLARDIPNRIPEGVVVQAVMAFLWGLTLPGWFLVLWPLAYGNLRLLARCSPECIDR